MASNITGGSVVWNFDVDSSKFEAGLLKAKIEANSLGSSLDKLGTSSASSLTQNLGGAFSSIALGLGALVKGIAVAATASSVGFGAMIGAALSQQRAVENARFALKAYEGDANKVNGVLSDLVKYATSPLGVLFQREELFKAASNLKVFGDETGKLVDHVKIISKVVALGFTNFDELSQILGRVGSQGKLMGQDFDVLTARGIKLAPSMRNAAVSFDQLFKAVSDAIPEGVLEGRADTIDGRLIRLKSSFRILGSEILGVNRETNTFITGGLGDRMLKLLDNLRITLGSPEIKEAFTNLGKSIASFAEHALPKLIELLSFVARNINTLAPAFIALAAAWGVASVAGVVLGLVLGPITLVAFAIAAAVTGLVAAFTFLQLKFNIVGKTIDFFKRNIEVIAPILVGIGVALAVAFGPAIIAGIVAAATAFGGMAISVAATAASMLIAAAPFIIIAAVVAAVAFGIYKLIKNWSAVSEFFVGVWQTVWAKVSSIASSVWKTVSSVFTSILNVITTILGAIWHVIQPVLTFIMNLFIIVFGSILIVVLTVLNIIKNIVFTVWNAVFVVISTVLGWIWDRITNAFNFYKDIIVSVFNAVWGFVSTIWNAIYDVISGIVQKLIDFFAPAFNWLLDRGKDIINGLVSGIKSVAGAVWDAIKFVADKIGDFFSGAWNWLYDTGKAIVQGLVNGIKDMIGAVAKAAEAVANTVKDKIKDLFGIHSPSKVFKQYGNNIVQGFVDGIIGSKNLLNSAMVQMGAELAGTNSNLTLQSSMGQSSSITPSSSSVVVQLNMNGIMARSRSDLRYIAKDMLESVNEELRAKGVEPIGGGAI